MTCQPEHTKGPGADDYLANIASEEFEAKRKLDGIEERVANLERELDSLRSHVETLQSEQPVTAKP